jgi:hypothetical protein
MIETNCMWDGRHDWWRALAVVSLWPLALGGCRPAAKVGRYEFIVRVASDPERPLAGASIMRGEVPLGRSDAEGIVRIGLQGREGEEVRLTVKCPEKFVSPPSPLSFKLRHLADSNRLPECTASCVPTERTVVVVVRTDGVKLPVLYLGQELARTDESGAAHVLLSAPAQTPFELTLGTEEAHAARLRPQNPSMRFIVPDHDDILPFDQRFTELPEEKRAPVRRRKPAPPPEDPGPLPL